MCPELIRIEVVFALPGRCVREVLVVPPDTTAAEAVRLSGIVDGAPQARAHLGTLGIHGREVEPGTMVRDGDRVEILRPLEVDPKVARRERAARR